MSSVHINDRAFDSAVHPGREDDHDPTAEFDGHSLFTASNDPNESYELRDMVSVGHSYVDRGMIDDAEEMLRDAVAAGYSRDDAVDLERRIRDARSIAAPMPSPRTSAPESSQRVAAISPDSFTRPLPGEDVQPSTVRHALAESEADIVAGRYAAAYDATLRAIALAPAFLPAYIRLAELRVAHGDSDGAEEIIRTLNDSLGVWGEDTDWLVLSLRVSLDPSDRQALTALARALLEKGGTLQLDPYVPDAIEHALKIRDLDVALELAGEYARLRPSDRTAMRLNLRALALRGDSAVAHAAIEREVTTDATADLLCLRAAVAYARDRSEWIWWLERATRRLLDHPEEREGIAEITEATRSLIPQFGHMLTVAVTGVATGDFDTAASALADWARSPVSTSDPREMLIAACARAFALRSVSPVEAIEALTRAVGEAVVIDVRPFAATCQLFPRGVSADALMHELVVAATETGQQDLAIMHLQALRDRLPEHLEIRAGLADLQVAAGRVGDGVRELRYIAERYERSGNFDRMVDAMRRISNAVPTNAEMKAKLIDGYVQRGIPDEAVRELGLLGDLHLKRGRLEAAATAFRRGAEIAATTSRIADAIDLFDRAIAADPDNVAHRHAAVAFYIMNGAVEKATHQLREVVRIALDSEDPDEAVAALHQIIGLAPDDAAAYHRLGEVLTSLGEYAQAERVYRRLGSFTSDDPVLAAKQSALAALASGS